MKELSAASAPAIRYLALRARLATVGERLVKNADFGVLSKAARSFVDRQASFVKSVRPVAELLRASYYPPNLRAIDGLYFEDMESVVMAEGIALYGVPRRAIAEKLIRAETGAKRREVLGRSWQAISADCRELVVSCHSTAVAAFVPFAIVALDALDGGYAAPAQALTASLIDAVSGVHFGKRRSNFVPNKKGTRTTSAYDELAVREFIAFAPMWQTYQQYDGAAPVPSTFSRHATAHSVSSRQYNRRNAVQGLLFACSLLYFIDERA